MEVSAVPNWEQSKEADKKWLRLNDENRSFELNKLIIIK